MNKLKDWLLRSENIQSAKSFSAFRIAFCLFMLVFIAHINYYRPLIFNNVPGLAYNPFPAKLFIVMWSIVVTMIMIGLKTRVASFINYLFVVIITFLFSNTGSGSFNDDLLRIGSFLMIIMPVERHFSIDSIIRNVRFGIQPVQKTSSLYYTASVFASLGLMYLASSITKFNSPMWQHGLGLWIPASMPYNKWHAIDFFLNMKWFMVTVNYITVLWEFLFIFFLFSKKWRWLFASLGIIFHAGIAILFPFPLLCFGPLVFYIFFIPDRFWERFRSKPVFIHINSESIHQLIFSRLLSSVNRNTTVDFHQNPGMKINGLLFQNNYKAALFALNKTRLGWLFAWLLSIEPVRLMGLALIDDGIRISQNINTPLFTNSFKRFCLVVFCVLLFSVQLFYSTYHLISHAKKGPVKTAEKVNGFVIRKDITDLSLKPSNLFRTLFGLNARGVFLDNSNTGTKTVFAVVNISQSGDTTWLPYFDKNGYTLNLNMNLAWSKYSFNSVCSGQIPNPHELEKTLWFWASKNQINTRNLSLRILKRTYIYPKQFEPGYQQKQASLPWLAIAAVSWPEGKFTYNTLPQQ